MKLTDGKRTISITMHSFDGASKGPDLSQEFFAAAGMPYDAETDAYTVQDVEYCIEQAEDWQAGRGDFYEDEHDSDPNTKLVLWEDIA